MEIEPFYDEVRSGKRERLDDLFLVACGFECKDKRDRIRGDLAREASRLMWMRNARSGNGQEATRSFESFWGSA
jgi:hypothetical protein